MTNVVEVARLAREEEAKRPNRRRKALRRG